METRILVIGSNGMLGHEVLRAFRDAGYETWGTQRDTTNIQDSKILQLDLLAEEKAIKVVLETVHPSVVINCAGVLKPLSDKDPSATIRVNSLAPHVLAKLTEHIQAKLIHITTDCVYDGKKGNYSEEDIPSPPDLYGKSKLAGEVQYGKHLTVRTSIIGHETRTQKYNLLDWFLQNTEATCYGFTNHFWNGVTTTELAKFLLFLTEKKSDFQGLLHFYGETVSKYHMLLLFKEVYSKQIEIKERTAAPCDRTLCSLRLASLGYTVSPLKDQLLDLKRNNITS